MEGIAGIAGASIGKGVVGGGVSSVGGKFSAPSPLATRRPLGVVPIAAVQPTIDSGIKCASESQSSISDFRQGRALKSSLREDVNIAKQSLIMATAIGEEDGMDDGPSYDTFEDCLHVANQMDSILSYYYADEDSHSVKVC